MAALPRLSRAVAEELSRTAPADLLVPAPDRLALPEKAVQFGTGAFLRGFVEYFIDQANRQGTFDGRVVVVGSTGSGRDAAFGEQDGLYTLTIQGIEDGAPRQEQRIVGAVSRALSAATEWDAVLACARDPRLALVFSNTTEVGIALDEGDSLELAPPRSFPGKLTRFLYERARAFDFAPAKGVVVLPCELIEANGDRLREIVLALADRWSLDPSFSRWIRASVPFCNTLVDRIVPGGLPETIGGDGAAASYRDALRTVCESYRLFAIEGDDALRTRLGFADADPGVLVAPDITPYRERKVRLLNGGHTISVPLALLAGCESVGEAVRHPLVGAFLRRAMLDEIAPTLGRPDAAAYAQAVLARFANPYVHHALFDITLQGTMKMRVRLVPTIVRHAERTGHAPDALALGFAAFLLFMRGDLHDARRTAGLPVPADDQGDRVRALWAAHGTGARGTPAAAALDTLVRAACADTALWGTDLTRVPGFAEAVRDHLARLLADGVTRTLETHLAGATA